MADNTDRLIRFLLPQGQCRGAIIRAENIVQEGSRLHGLSGSPAGLFGQGLIASILLLSISKGGLRQVLQLDGEGGPVSRLLAECGNNAVRGYMQWTDQASQQPESNGDLDWLGHHIKLSTVRDLGVGQPYVSTIEAGSPYMADVLIQYLSQSVQIRADIILQDDLGLMIEAMPGCDDGHWFRAVEAMAGISQEKLEASPEAILESFASLGCKTVGVDEYGYRCRCNPEIMAQAISAMPAEDLHGLRNDDGNITLTCRYCNTSYEMDAPSI